MPRTLTATLVATAATAVLTATVAAPAGAAEITGGSSPLGPVAGRADTIDSQRSLAAATTATPGGSIVFIKNHNVWLTRPDGSGARAVTADGTATLPYDHPTMSDNGTIAVMRGSTIYRMGQNGVLLNKMVARDLFVPDYGTLLISPVQGAEISPDGSKIAYSQLRLEHYGGGDYNYNVTESMTSFTDAAQWSGPDKYGILSGAYAPSWIGNSRVVVDTSGDVALANLGQAPVQWFTSDDVYAITDPLAPFIPLSQPEVSRDRQSVVFGNPGGIGLWATNGDPAGASPGKPLGGDAGMRCALTSGKDEPVAIDPSFGPDSDSVAFSENGNLSVVTSFSACEYGAVVRQIVAGGTEPDWSPAPLSAPPATGPTSPSGGGTAGQPGTHAFSLLKAPVLVGKAKVGRRLRAQAGTWSPSPASVSYTWLRNGRVVKGRTGATYALRRVDRGKRIQVRVTVRRTGYAAMSAVSKALRVKR